MSTSTSEQVPLQQSLLPAPPASNGAATSLEIIDPNMDLLSGENFSKPTSENSLALVPVTDLVDGSASSGTEHNILALSDIFSQNSNNSNKPTNAMDSNTVYPASRTYPASPQLQLEPQQPTYYSNGSVPNSGVPQYEQAAYIQGTQLNQANPAWNSQSSHVLSSQQQATYNTNDKGVLPLPPWEAQTVHNNQLVGPQQMQSGQLEGGIHPQPIQSNHLGGMHPGLIQNNQQIGMPTPPMQGNQLGGLYSQPIQGGQFIGMQQQLMQGVQWIDYGYGQQPVDLHYNQRPLYPYAGGPNEISQRMYGLSLQDNNSYMNTNSSYPISTSSTFNSQQSHRPSKPEDKLFGDLVSLAKSKQNKSNENKLGSL